MLTFNYNGKLTNVDLVRTENDGAMFGFVFMTKNGEEVTVEISTDSLISFMSYLLCVKLWCALSDEEFLDHMPEAFLKRGKVFDTVISEGWMNTLYTTPRGAKIYRSNGILCCIKTSDIGVYGKPVVSMLINGDVKKPFELLLDHAGILDFMDAILIAQA